MTSDERPVRTWIAVPCYNEAERLPASAFEGYLADARDVGFIFVNDGSQDDTLGVLRAIAARFPSRVDVVDQRPNRGKAEAVRVGMLRAFGKPDAVYAGYFDADLATPLDAIVEFTRTLDEQPDIEIVIGARVALLGRAIERQPVRHYLGRVFATVASLALGLAVYDTQCGAKIFRCSPSLSALFARPFGSRWIFDVELLARYLTGDGRPQGLYELPLKRWTDVGESRVKAVDFVRAVAEMASIYRTYRAHQQWAALLGALTAPFVRYVAAGGLGTGVHYATLALLVEAVDMAPARGTVVGALAGAAVNYVLNYYFTFASRASHRKTLPRFFAVAVLSTALNGLGMWLLSEKLGAHYLVAQLLCTLSVLVTGYVLNRAWTFRRAPAEAQQVLAESLRSVKPSPPTDADATDVARRQDSSAPPSGPHVGGS